MIRASVYSVTETEHMEIQKGISQCIHGQDCHISDHRKVNAAIKKANKLSNKERGMAWYHAWDNVHNLWI